MAHSSPSTRTKYPIFKTCFRTSSSTAKPIPPCQHEFFDRFHQAKRDKIEYRYGLIIAWLKAFQDSHRKLLHHEISFRDGKNVEDMALAINTAYWIRYEKLFQLHVRGKDGNDTNINISKIISGIELAIIDQHPFKEEDNTPGNPLNAQFSMFVSTNIMTTWYEFDTLKYNLAIADDKEIKKFIEDHTTWLINLQPEFEYPIYLNAQLWSLYIKLIKTILQQ